MSDSETEYQYSSEEEILEDSVESTNDDEQSSEVYDLSSLFSQIDFSQSSNSLTCIICLKSFSILKGYILSCSLPSLFKDTNNYVITHDQEIKNKLDTFVTKIYSQHLTDIGHGCLCSECAVSLSITHRETLGSQCPGCRNRSDLRVLSAKIIDDSLEAKIEDFPLNHTDILNQVLCQQLNSNQKERIRNGYYDRTLHWM